LPEETGPVAALREVLLLCLQANPVQRPSATTLLRSPELRALSECVGVAVDMPAEDTGLEEDEVEKSVAVADLIQSLLERFGQHGSEGSSLESNTLDLLRDRLHRSLEEQDKSSAELLGCWLHFVRSCPQVGLESPDLLTQRTLLHALVQSHSSDSLLEILENHCEGQNSDSLSSMVNVKDEHGRGALALAASQGMSPHVCLRLLELGASVEELDDDGESPMMKCLKQGFERPGERRRDIITVLLAYGAKVPEQAKGRRLSYPMQDVLKQNQVNAQRQAQIWSQELLSARQLRSKLRAFAACGDCEEDSFPASSLGSVDECRDLQDEFQGADSQPSTRPSSAGSSSSTLAAGSGLSAAMALRKAAGPGAAVAAEFEILPQPAAGEALCTSADHEQENLEPLALSRFTTDYQEDALKTYLIKSSHNHDRTAFKICDKRGKSEVTAQEFARLLQDILPGADADRLRRRLQQRWSKGVSFRPFSTWLRSPSTSKLRADSPACRSRSPKPLTQRLVPSPARRHSEPRLQPARRHSEPRLEH